MPQHVKLGLNNKVISKGKVPPLKAFFWKRDNYVLGNSQWPFRKANWRKVHTFDPPDTSFAKFTLPFPATRVEIGHHSHHYSHHHHHHGHHQVFYVLSDESGDVFCCGSPSHKYCCTRRDQVLQQEMEGWVGHLGQTQKNEQVDQLGPEEKVEQVEHIGFVHDVEQVDQLRLEHLSCKNCLCGCVRT